MRKSSTGSRSSLAFTRAWTVFANSAGGVPSGAASPIAAAKAPAEGACSAKALSASEPSLGTESKRKSWAPP